MPVRARREEPEMRDVERSDVAQAVRLARRPLLLASAAALGSAALGIPLPRPRRSSCPPWRRVRLRHCGNFEFRKLTRPSRRRWPWRGQATMFRSPMAPIKGITPGPGPEAPRGKRLVVIKARNRSKAVLAGLIQLRSPTCGCMGCGPPLRHSARLGRPFRHQIRGQPHLGDTVRDRLPGQAPI